MLNGRPDSESISEFVADTNEREFLFDKEIIKYIDNMIKKAINLRQLERKLSNSNLPVGEERTRLADENFNLSNWFGDQFDVSKALFKKYLGFKK